jgi:putative SOS response-associated peptidase YedK
MNKPKLFAFAGLWEQWWSGDKGSEGPPLESCTILTTEANDLVERIHDRMPVILDACDYDAWLDPANTEVAYLLAQLPVDRMSSRPLASTFVNNVRNQGPECVA